MVLYGLTVLIPYLQQLNAQEEDEIVADFNFYPADYDENIFEDPEYLSLISDGILMYDDSYMATTVDKESAKYFGGQVEMLVNMVYSVINGNAAEYNSYFSEKYFENNSAKSKFTMQKIYNATLTYFSAEGVEDKNGNKYTQYTYKLIYNIYENNGTFRKDIGDDARAQYIVISEYNGKFLIDSIDLSRYYK